MTVMFPKFQHYTFFVDNFFPKGLVSDNWVSHPAEYVTLTLCDHFAASGFLPARVPFGFAGFV